MKLFPAIDLLDGCAVRLKKGDYQQKTVYSTDPVSVAKSFKAAGCEFIHVVDLDGARDGSQANFETIAAIARESGLGVEIGGGIRDEAAVKRYLDLGVMRVILGTAAVEKPGFAREMAGCYGEKIAVGVDIKDGMVATRGWKEVSSRTTFEFCEEMEAIGVKTVICTDISRDGMLSGPASELYKELSSRFSMDFVASGGVSSLEDLRALRKMGLYGAILGKALYEGRVDLAAAVREMEADV